MGKEGKMYITCAHFYRELEEGQGAIRCFSGVEKELISYGERCNPVHYNTLIKTCPKE